MITTHIFLHSKWYYNLHFTVQPSIVELQINEPCNLENSESRNWWVKLMSGWPNLLLIIFLKWRENNGYIWFYCKSAHYPKWSGWWQYLELTEQVYKGQSGLYIFKYKMKYTWSTDYTDSVWYVIIVLLFGLYPGLLYSFPNHMIQGKKVNCLIGWVICSNRRNTEPTQKCNHIYILLKVITFWVDVPFEWCGSLTDWWSCLCCGLLRDIQSISYNSFCRQKKWSKYKSISWPGWISHLWDGVFQEQTYGSEQKTT